MELFTTCCVLCLYYTSSSHLHSSSNQITSEAYPACLSRRSLALRLGVIRENPTTTPAQAKIHLAACPHRRKASQDHIVRRLLSTEETCGLRKRPASPVSRTPSHGALTQLRGTMRACWNWPISLWGCANRSRSGDGNPLFLTQIAQAYPCRET